MSPVSKNAASALGQLTSASGKHFVRILREMWRSVIIPIGPLAAALSLGFAFQFDAAAAERTRIDFKREIQPILVKRCSECHGPDKQKSNLRLDSRAAALKSAESGLPAVVPGASARSEIIARVTATDLDDRMPPKGDPLPPEQIAALKAWIDEGAAWTEWDASKHWSFTRIQRTPVPQLVQFPKQVRNDIDRFIVARLEQEKLSPSPEADRHALIRRLSLDLTGLPPTWAEAEAFAKDKRSMAYEELVDRLLASPRYGEHIARWWLDLARYADSNGYQVDLARPVWAYRDWVINAFNDNMRFDQFTVEQLAGDLLPNATLQQRIATGFNRQSKINDEGGSDDEEHRVKAVKDRVATVGATWLGLTLMCAECHTHKYDPITQEEYYRIYAYFNNTEDKGTHSIEPTIPVPPPIMQRRVDHLRAEIAAAKSALADAERQLPGEQAAWERRMAAKGAVWTSLALTNLFSNGGSSYTNLPDSSVLGIGINPIYDTITAEAVTFQENITAVLLEVLPDKSLPKNGPGRWRDSGNFILDEFALGAALSRPGAQSSPVPFERAQADWEQRYYQAQHAIDLNPKTGWAIGPRFGQPHFLIAELKAPAGHPGGTRLDFRFDHYHGNSHALGRFRLSITSERDRAALWPLPADIAALLKTPAADRTSAQLRQLAEFYRAVSPVIRELEFKLARLNERETDLAATKYSTLVMKERAEPRPSHIQIRGNFLDKGGVVTPGAPAFLPSPAEGEPANRLGFARWLVDPAHPLTARVTANRLWERFFGTGIVKTSEDLGRQGETPSHPELLDWLAAELIAGGWNLKALQKTIVLSAAYRQHAAADPRKLEKDVYNRLLARGPRFRMDAEMLRDNALFVSGLLHEEIGGPSVYPVQVANLWKEIGFLRPEIGMDEWPVSAGTDLYRRGLYTFWRRVCTYPSFSTFDAPSRENCTSRRPRTNTPLQALAALNEPTLLEAARVFAQRIVLEGGARPSQQIDFAFRTGLQRPPTPAEKRRLLEFYQQQLAGFSAEPSAARQLIDVGAAERPKQLDATILAAWMMVANVLLNLDETLTKG